MTSTIRELILKTSKSVGPVDYEALYNLKVEIVDEKSSIKRRGFFPDERIIAENGKCNAS